MKYLREDEWSEVVTHISEDSNRKAFEKIFKMMNVIWTNIQGTKVSQLVISTAMIYFHRYFLINNFEIERDIDKILICSSCLFIAVKSTNSFLHLEKMVETVWNLINKKSPGKYSKDFIAEGILSHEFLVLSSFGFDCNWDLPYLFIPKIKNVIASSIKADLHKVCTLWTYYINDSYVLPICLYYTPEVIAFSTLGLLCEVHNIKIDLTDAFAAVGIVNIAHRDIEDCSKALRLIYKQSEQCKCKEDEEDIQMKSIENGKTASTPTKVYFS